MSGGRNDTEYILEAGIQINHLHNIHSYQEDQQVKSAAADFVSESGSYLLLACVSFPTR